MLSLPGYEGVVLVGEGGLGRVYRATRVSTGGTVAVKELHDVAEASPSWHRALREVEAMLRLKGHPNVVSVEEVLIGPGGPCIVMEFLGGGSLHDRLQLGHLSVAEVVLVGQQVASALSAAHAGGVIHRDVKPHNLLVSGFGHVKVADFGIAALMRDSGVRTQTQSLTLAYASPEELDGALDVGPQTDVYSLAATLAHLATGQKPSFRDRSLAVLPFDGEPALAHVGQTLRRCLAIEPDQRPRMADLVVLFDDAQSRLGDRRLGSLPMATAAFAPARAAAPGVVKDPSEITIPRQVPAATIVKQRAVAPPPPPPATMAPLPPTVVSPVLQSIPPRSGGNRKTPIVIAAVLIALIVGGVAVLAATGGSKGDESKVADTFAPTDFGATVSESSPTATQAPVTSAPIAVTAATEPSSPIVTPAVTTPPTAAPTIAPTLAPEFAGDLGLAVPISQPACDGQFVTMVGGSTQEDQHVRIISVLLERYSGSNYMRNENVCTSLRGRKDGIAIYQVFFGPYSTLADACAARAFGPAEAYVRVLDNVSDPANPIAC